MKIPFVAMSDSIHVACWISQIAEQRVSARMQEIHETLEDDDILCIDSSHALKSGGDVQTEYLEILPRLTLGMLFHTHNMILPQASFDFSPDHA